VPLVRGERIIGAFMFRRCKPAPFNRSLLQMLQTVAALSVLAIDGFGSPGGSPPRG
jgi:GAF domain-containing protein